jgi:Cys-rich protein (TIGR04453 family)
LLLLGGVFGGCVLGGCAEDDACAEACLRVARCRKEAREGEGILGERDLPPDATCMRRCRDHHDEWSQCEGSQHGCEGLRRCLGPLR